MSTIDGCSCSCCFLRLARKTMTPTHNRSKQHAPTAATIYIHTGDDASAGVFSSVLPMLTSGNDVWPLFVLGASTLESDSVDLDVVVCWTIEVVLGGAGVWPGRVGFVGGNVKIFGIVVVVVVGVVVVVVGIISYTARRRKHLTPTSESILKFKILNFDLNFCRSWLRQR